MSIDNVTDTARRVQYTASAAQTVFPYTFAIFDEDDLVVEVDGAIQTITTDYTVSGVEEDAGGNVTFVSGMTGGEIVTIHSDTTIARTSDFQQNGPNLSTVMNDELDRITVVQQELRESIRRAIRFPMSTAFDSDDIELSPASAWRERYLFINSDDELEPAVNLTTTTLTQSVIGGLLYPQTADELAAAVTPTDYSYPPCHVLRYGAVGDDLTDNTEEIQRAIDSAGISGEVLFPATGLFRCTSNLTVPNFQTWRCASYELGAGGSQAGIKSTLTTGVFITTGSSFKAEGIRFVGVMSYNDLTGAVADSTTICIRAEDNVTLRDCVFQLQFRCIELSSAVYSRVFGGEVVRCAAFIDMVDADVFNLEVHGTIFRYCNTTLFSSDSPVRYAHNFKMFGGSFENWPTGLFSAIASATFYGTYFECIELEGGIGFNSAADFTNDVVLKLDGCMIFLNHLDRFVNFSGLTGGTFVSVGNTIACSVNTAEDQVYFHAMDSGGNVTMIGDKLDDRGGTFEGVYIDDTTKVRNQLIQFPYEHANGGQTWVPGGIPLVQTSTTAALEAVANAINTANKFNGKILRNTTSNKLVIAQGSTAGSTWISVDGATTHTPV